MLHPGKVATSVGLSIGPGPSKYMQLQGLQEGTEARDSRSERTLVQLHDLHLMCVPWYTGEMSWHAARGTHVRIEQHVDDTITYHRPTVARACAFEGLPEVLLSTFKC